MNSGANVDAELAVGRLHRTTRRALLLAAAGWILAPLRLGAAQDGAPWFGTWEQELGRPASRFETPPYKKVTTRIEPYREGAGAAAGNLAGPAAGNSVTGDADGVRVTYDMVRARGGITHVEWVGRFDGRDYPVQGVDSFLTNAYRILDERRYEIVIKVDTVVVATATATVSTDGQTLTVTTVERDASGRPSTSTAIYRRKSAANSAFNSQF